MCSWGSKRCSGRISLHSLPFRCSNIATSSVYKAFGLKAFAEILEGFFWTFSITHKVFHSERHEAITCYLKLIRKSTWSWWWSPKSISPAYLRCSCRSSRSSGLILLDDTSHNTYNTCVSLDSVCMKIASVTVRIVKILVHSNFWNFLKSGCTLQIKSE